MLFNLASLYMLYICIFSFRHTQKDVTKKNQIIKAKIFKYLVELNSF